MIAEADDGANTLRIGGVLTGMPDGNHIDNANFGTPPDGFAPGCRCTCSTAPFAPDPFLRSNGGDEASIVYHEYTHGLSNRLVVDADGQLDARRHPGRRDGRGVERLVREDFLVAQGFVTDTPAWPTCSRATTSPAATT